MSDLQRSELVRALVALDRPLDVIVDALRPFEWDYFGAPVLVRRRDLISVLKRYIDGQLDGVTVSKWAETLEFRDDVEVDEGEPHKDAIEAGLHDLANPDIQGSLTKQYALDLLRVLET